MTATRRIYIYDSTLRDGAQTASVDFTLQNKIDIAHLLDGLNVDYIEAGWPGANPLDSNFFTNLPKLNYAKFAAFGMTRKAMQEASEDNNLTNLAAQKTEIVTIVGKSWDFHVEVALKTSLTENLNMIKDSIEFLGRDKQVFFDAEHFFDGYKKNPKYALEVIQMAYESGARFIILCDTNGGTLPHEIYDIVTEVTKFIPGENLGIHCHNDTGNAVANSIEAVRAGVSQVQGTLNGLGERCGNANLITLIPIFILKFGYDLGIKKEDLQELKHVSNFLSDILNRTYDNYAPFIGSSAFAHKGGLHASAIVKNSELYEHVDPELFSNSRNILVSNQSGRASIISKLQELDINYLTDEDKVTKLINLVKDKEAFGYSYDSANASFAILAFKIFAQKFDFFTLDYYRVLDEKRVITETEIINISTAIIKLKISGGEVLNVAEGNGPVNALDKAFKKSLLNFYPILGQTKLTDYKVRILNSESATEALIRVLIEMKDDSGNRWISVGVSTDLIDASFQALFDAYNYYLFCKINK